MVWQKSVRSEIEQTAHQDALVELLFVFLYFFMQVTWLLNYKCAKESSYWSYVFYAVTDVRK